AEWLAQDQAGVGREGVDPSAADLSAEHLVILVGQVAAQAEPEPAFAGRSAVTGTHVTASLAEGRDHVVTEADRRRGLHPIDLDRRARLDAALAGHDRRRSVTLRYDLPLRRH